METILPIALGGAAILVMLLWSSWSHRRQARVKRESKSPVLNILVHDINDDRCTGCDACVAVCPTNVLDLVNNKSRVLRFQDCIQCEACMWACPTEALVMFRQGSEPPPLKMPEIDENFETAIEGQYLIGEVAGKPLVKNAANLGRAVVEHMTQMGLKARGPEKAQSNFVDVAIVGSGPAGVSAALTCIKKGLSYIMLEKEQFIASTIKRYPKGKLVMAEPYDTRNLSYLPVFDSSKEQLIPIWEDVIRELGVRVQLGESVESVKRHSSGIFKIVTNQAKYAAQRVILATGTRGKPRTLSIPGENLPKVYSLLDDPEDFRGQPVIVVGGGDSAVEAAIALADAGASVLVSYRSKAFNRAQPKNKDAINSYIAQKRIKVLYQSQVTLISKEQVVVELIDGTQKRYPNAAAFILIGSEPPIKWLAQMGIDFVERPHQYSLGKTDEIVMRHAPDARECPENAQDAIAVLRGKRVSPPTRSQSVVGKLAAKLTGKVRQPTYGRAGTHSGTGRRDSLSVSERARVLRSLRDDGARLADEESKVEFLREKSSPSVPAIITDTPQPTQNVVSSKKLAQKATLRKAPPLSVPPPLPTSRPGTENEETRAIDLSQLEGKGSPFISRSRTEDDEFSDDQTKAVDLGALTPLLRETAHSDGGPRLDSGEEATNEHFDDEDATRVFDDALPTKDSHGK